MHNAIQFREKEMIDTLPTKRGYYKWWAEKEEFDLILDTLDVKYEDIKDYIEKKDDLYCIYLGIATKSLRQRINWHINDKHDRKSVESKYLSTLRQTIASIVAKDQYNKDATNHFIDKLKFEIFEYDDVKNIEKKLLLTNLYILNIQDNNHFAASEIKRKLKKLRKESR